MFSGRWESIGRVAAVALVVGMAAVSPAQASERLVVFAAASLKNALDDVERAYIAQTGGDVAISYAGSSALARQIEQGAPADMFVSADLDWMAYLSERGFTRKDSETRLLGNRMVLVAPAGSGADIKIDKGFDLAGLLGDGRLAMANTDAVPAGKYGKASLEALGVWPSIEGKIAQAENVRAALALVSTGEAPLGIVYQTDAAADPNVRIIGVFPEDTHPHIVYPVAILAGSKNADAEGFLKFMETDKAKTLFERQGFAVLVPPVAN